MLARLIRASPLPAARSWRQGSAVPVLLALAVGSLGVGLRVYVYRSSLGIPDSDEAVVGLMARHVLLGQFTAFFWGQGYGGSQEAVLTAPLFFVFGSSWLTLRIVPMLLMLLGTPLAWRIAGRLFGQTAGLTAAALWWVWPPFALYKTTHQWGFYASGDLYVLLLLLLALRAAERPTAQRAAAFGFVCGLALWEDAQLVPVIIPTVVWMLRRRPRLLRNLWLALAFAALGGLPWLLWNVHHGFGSFQTHLAAHSSYAHRLRVFFSPLLPMLLGLRTPFSQKALLSGVLVDIGLLALLALFAYGAWRSRHREASLLYAVAATFPFIYALSRQTLFSSEPRYLLVLAPVLVLLASQLARTAATAVALVVVAAALSAITLHRMDVWQRTTPPLPPNPPIAAQGIQPLLDALKRARIDRVYAQYWAAYRIDFESRERIIAAESKLTTLRITNGRPVPGTTKFTRWPTYNREVAAATRVAFVFTDWPSDHNRAKRQHVMSQLAALGFTHQRFTDVILLLPPRHPPLLSS